MGKPAPLPYPPLNFTRDEALAYTGWAPKYFDMLEQAGTITGRRIGRNGAIIYAREELEAVNRTITGGAAANDIDDEFSALDR